MNERKAIFNLENRILCAILAMLLILSVVIVDLQSVRSASADVITYSNVLDDLKKDKSFNADDWAINENSSDVGEFRLEVITIAEGANGELFVYVYDKNYKLDKRGKHIATRISLSLSEAKDVDPSLYSLVYLNKSDQFFKYKVNGLDYNKIEAFKDSDTHYYFLVSVFRAYDETVDTKAPSDQTISEVSFGVGQEHTFKTENGVTTHTVQAKEVLKITEKYVGFFRYETIHLGGYITGLDSHFVAFDSNWQIDDLLEVKLSFFTSRYQYHHNGFWVTEDGFSESEEQEILIHKKDVGGGELSNFWFQTYGYEWPRIQKFEDFVKDLDGSFEVWCGVIFSITESLQVTDEELLAQSENGDYKYKWILRFYDSNYDSGPTTGLFGFEGRRRSYIRVSNVVLLRMYFESNGKLYNLGVVDNIQTGSSTPSGKNTNPELGLNDRTKELLKLIEKVFKVLMFVIIVVAVLVVLYPILPVIGKVFAAIITAPVKLVKNIKQASDEKKSKGKK